MPSPGMWKPKQWRTPRARWRRAISMTSTRAVLEYRYGCERPRWAYDAVKRHWMSYEAFVRVPAIESRSRLYKLMYTNYPDFKLPRATYGGG